MQILKITFSEFILFINEIKYFFDYDTNKSRYGPNLKKKIKQKYNKFESKSWKLMKSQIYNQILCKFLTNSFSNLKQNQTQPNSN